jgi:hypothetical protein
MGRFWRERQRATEANQVKERGGYRKRAKVGFKAGSFSKEGVDRGSLKFPAALVRRANGRNRTAKSRLRQDAI